mmetsp:Transcript_11725/g.13601  ORF Transcript_11725/g.13601 Transcript_11725/m.13601 type:complete len:211 (+) Transcript_11725:192-824(+)
MSSKVKQESKVKRQGMASKESPSKKARTDAKDEGKEAVDEILINRAPVLSLWVSVVASQQEEYSWQSCLTFGRYITGVFSYSKGKALGIYADKSKTEKDVKENKSDKEFASVFGKKIPVKKVKGELRAIDSYGKIIKPEVVERYLKNKFGKNLDRVRSAMDGLAKSKGNKIEKEAYDLYVKFRPQVSYGKQGWGQQSFLSIKQINSLADK